MTDYLIKALAFNGEIRAFAVDATKTVETAHEMHDTWSASSAALGRTLIANVMFAKNLKGDDEISVQVNGDGLGGKIFTTAKANGDVKGYISNPRVVLPPTEAGKINVRAVVGTEGTITVIKDLGLKEPFTGQIPIVDGELGADFTYYMAVSEQINGAIGLSVLVDTDDTIRTAGGFMVQVMPGASEETLEILEKRLATLPQISQLMDKGATPEDILTALFGEENYQVLSHEPIQFKCHCSKERFATGLKSLGRAELKAMIDEDHGAEVVCHFCNKKYFFDVDELQAMIDDITAKITKIEQEVDEDNARIDDIAEDQDDKDGEL